MWWPLMMSMCPCEPADRALVTTVVLWVRGGRGRRLGPGATLGYRLLLHHHPASGQWSEEAAPAPPAGAGTWQLTPEPETGRGPGSGSHHKSRSGVRVVSVETRRPPISDQCPALRSARPSDTGIVRCEMWETTSIFKILSSLVIVTKGRDKLTAQARLSCRHNEIVLMIQCLSIIISLSGSVSERYLSNVGGPGRRKGGRPSVCGVSHSLPSVLYILWCCDVGPQLLWLRCRRAVGNRAWARPEGDARNETHT